MLGLFYFSQVCSAHFQFILPHISSYYFAGWFSFANSIPIES